MSKEIDKIKDDIRQMKLDMVHYHSGCMTKGDVERVVGDYNNALKPGMEVTDPETNSQVYIGYQAGDDVDSLWQVPFGHRAVTDSKVGKEVDCSKPVPGSIAPTNQDIVKGITDGHLEVKGKATEYVRELEKENKRLKQDYSDAVKAFQDYKKVLEEVYCKYYTAITLLNGQRNWLGAEIAKGDNDE